MVSSEPGSVAVQDNTSTPYPHGGWLTQGEAIIGTSALFAFTSLLGRWPQHKHKEFTCCGWPQRSRVVAPLHHVVASGTTEVDSLPAAERDLLPGDTGRLLLSESRLGERGLAMLAGVEYGCIL